MTLLEDFRKPDLEEVLHTKHGRPLTSYPLLYAPTNEPSQVDVERDFSLKTILAIIRNVIEIIKS